jgi:hypothetical protein
MNRNNNTGITLTDVRAEAMDTIRKLKNKEIDVKTAGAVRGLLDTIIDTAKTQVEFLKAIPNSIKENMGENDVKAIAGTLRDRDAELDQSLAEIEERKRQPYQ